MAKFLEGMRALVRKDVFRNAAQYLEVDIKAAGISTGPAATPMKPGRKAERAPTPAPTKSRKAASARSAPSRKAPSRPAPSRPAPSRPAPSRPAPRKKTAAPRAAGGAARPAVAPAKARAKSAGKAQAPAVGAGDKGTQPANPTSPENAPSGIPENEIAEALLAHVEIEPGQGIDDLALAMGTPAADLQEPIKKLLEENKITEELRQGQASYYPT
ncbi:hypothetical protein [Sorangium sp. So ce1153]|uniref:hypothetical protein n=1 Tax=Sorangium sp. So ce1153 TaxID=3133333 RepID=UPI003F5D9B83